MSYSIKVLVDKEFDRLPYQMVREAFAVTSPDKQNIYVRYTNVHDFNRMLVSHELDHLVEEVPTDVGPNGERYFLGALLSTLGSLFTKALPAIGKFATSTIPSAIGKVGSSVLGGAKSLGSGVMNMFGSGGGQIPSNSSSFMSQPQTALKSFASPVASTIGKGFNPLSMFGSGTNTNNSNNLFGLNKNLLGAGMIGAGLLKKYPKVPPVSESLNQVRGMAQQGGTPLGQQAQGVLSSRLGSQFEPMSEPEIQAALRGLEMEKKQNLDRIHDQYKNLRPGSDPMTDSTYNKEITDLEDQFARAKSDVLATRTRDLKQSFDAKQLQDIQTSLGASDQEMQYLYNIALQDDTHIMADLGLNAQQVQSFKDVFLNLGASLIKPPGLMDQFLTSMVKG